MKLDRQAREEILDAITKLGSEGALITEIAGNVSCERHTLAKYLAVMESEHIVYHKQIGKAKLWFIQKAPLRAAITLPAVRQTFREHALSQVIERLPHGVAITDETGSVMFMNRRASEHYGGAAGDFLGALLGGVKAACSFDRVLKGVRESRQESSGEFVDRRRRYIQLSASPFVHDDGSTAFLFIISDLSARKAAENELAAQKQLLEAERRALNESAIVAETDLQGNITYANDKFVKLSGYSREELLGKTHKIVNSGHHPPAFFRSLWRTISGGKVWHGTVKDRAKDGSCYWLESALAPVMGKHGKPSKYIAIRFDVTKYLVSIKHRR